MDAKREAVGAQPRQRWRALLEAQALEAARARLPPEGLPRCEGCGADIEPERLQALPEARCRLRGAARGR
ncbi:hypothetical protein [Corallococcus exercitus]|uniref:hypothetical protein n=1 Tax=Corallococcus exercitus TaxID=2316736 RepID=UPI0035D4F78D